MWFGYYDEELNRLKLRVKECESWEEFEDIYKMYERTCTSSIFNMNMSRFISCCLYPDVEEFEEYERCLVLHISTDCLKLEAVKILFQNLENISYSETGAKYRLKGKKRIIRKLFKDGIYLVDM